MHLSIWNSGVIFKNTTVLVLCLILEKKSSEDGILLFYQPHIHICCERILLFLRNMFKFLRKKLCYSVMIMVLSCCDLLALLTNNPLMALIMMLRLTGKLDGNARWAYISLRSTAIFLAFSLFALLEMNFDRYLATSYLIFDRTSVTKGRLLKCLSPNFFYFTIWKWSILVMIFFGNKSIFTLFLCFFSVKTVWK
jgi:hypothetical protein